MANETIYPYGQGGQTPSGIGLNAGTFADAYDLAKENNYIFPWLLIDEGDDGTLIKKMIWHVGNGVFIDAIGSEITGIKNGITIKADAPGVLKYTASGLTTTAGELPFIDGEVNYTFNEVASILKTANNNTSSTFNGKTINVTDITYDGTTPSQLEIDFGWATVQWSGGQLQPTVIKRMNITSAYQLFDGSTRLVEAQISGTIAGHATRFLRSTKNLVKLDLSGLKNTTTFYGMSDFICFNSGTASNYVLKKVDIRNISTAGVANISVLVYAVGLKTLIIGNFNTASATNYTSFNGVTGATLVCTRDTPPTMHSTWDFITGHFTSIKVPNKTVEVNGEEVTVLSLYQSAAGWSTHAGIMSTYEEGEY